jgi:hypothetical protein
MDRSDPSYAHSGLSLGCDALGQVSMTGMCCNIEGDRPARRRISPSNRSVPGQDCLDLSRWYSHMDGTRHQQRL